VTLVYLPYFGPTVACDVLRDARIALCRFAAENLLSETAALKNSIINGAASLAAARIALV
jgi:hypothetical protein